MFNLFKAEILSLSWEAEVSEPVLRTVSGNLSGRRGYRLGPIFSGVPGKKRVEKETISDRPVQPPESQQDSKIPGFWVLSWMVLEVEGALPSREICRFWAVESSGTILGSTQLELHPNLATREKT